MLGCSGNGEQMRQQLEALEQQNVSGEPMLNDSLAESLVSYFDKHCDANEQTVSRWLAAQNKDLKIADFKRFTLVAE